MGNITFHQFLVESIQLAVSMDSSMTSNLLNPKFRPIVEAQRHQTSEMMNVSKPIQFKNVRHQNEAKALATRFLFECGVKLKTKSVTLAVAAQIYHRFYEAASEANYDAYVITIHVPLFFVCIVISVISISLADSCNMPVHSKQAAR